MDFLKSFAAVTEATEAQFKLAIFRSEAMQNFYRAERHAGATALEANERLHFFMKRLDARSPFEVEQEAVKQIMESVS